MTDQPDPQPDTTPQQPAHVKFVYSTRPGRALLRREACTCDTGRDHSSYESPGK